MKSFRSAGALLRHPVLLGMAVLLILLMVFFDWNWFKGPLERYVSKKTQREFTLTDLDVDLGFTPTIRMRGVHFGNAAWSSVGDPMADIEALEFSVSLRALPDKILVPRVALTRPTLLLERQADDRKNWVFSEPSDTSPSRLVISTLSVDQGRLRFIDHGEPFSIDVKASTFTPFSEAQPTSKEGPPSPATDAKSSNTIYLARFAFSGQYHKAAFSGEALTGEVLSFQQSGQPFPIKASLVAGSTRVQVEGTIADAANISAIDTQLRIQGETLANLYPFLLLPLPASPPYQLQGRLQLNGNRFAMDNLSGKIGSSDISGSAGYIRQEPRPMLTADLKSRLLDITDLGPLVGVQTKSSGGKPAISQAESSNRPQAAAKSKAVDPDHILPSGTFDGSRLQKIDADFKLNAAKLKVPVDLPLESLNASLTLRDGVLNLNPLNIGFAGGMMSSKIMLDGRRPVISTEATVNLRRVQLAKLMPDNKTIAQSGGLLGALIQLKGSGNSVADAAAKSNGRMSAAIVDGRISNLLDAASGLNGGKVLQLLAGGDQAIKVNCGGFSFDVKNGLGQSSVFVIDTEQTQILGTGGFNLADETFDLTLTPRPKSMGILSLRTPVRTFGTFKNPEFELHKGPLLARAAGAVALLSVAPLAALIPLLETGPGESTDCLELQAGLSSAQKQAQGVAPAAPAKKGVTRPARAKVQ
ncbi:MAG: AsmA family protein [Polaromonas sp.]|nr:AsmA family protein [Polaromonas sp.]